MKKDEYASCPRFVFISSVKQYNPLMRAIKKLRLNVKSGDKFIPWHYLTSSIEDRIALLQGLMDTDGSCIKNRSVFHTTSKNLAHDFADLVRGLGGYCSINMYDRGVKGIEYQIPIRFKNLCPFRSERKKANWKPVQKGTDYKSIVDIVKTGEFVEQACISVDNPTHLYITDGYNVTHNTASTLTALQSLKDQGKIKRTLIIAPLRVANSVWAQEIEKWEHISLRPVICTGGEEKRVRALTSAGDLFIINRENVKWLVDLAKKKKKWPFDCVVIDESSSFKSPSSRRFKALKLALPKINYMVLLTGTPAPNSLMDIWSQIFLIDQGERLGKTMGNFKNRYFHQTGYGGYTYQLTHGADNEIHDKISDVCLTMKAEDYLDMPERIDINTVCPMPAKARAEYNKLESEFFIQLETGEIEVSTSAVMANKL
ncbi:MAG: hypothetical protein EBT51_12300, partial [Flavobacteriaceae bacterium]|nr:hypothetical protein [Flavobacteriaceae bacterium]